MTYRPGRRADRLATALLTNVPGSYAELASVFAAARNGSPRLDGGMVWSVTVAAAQRAVADGSDESFDGAIELLASLTPRLSAEFAPR